MRFLPILFVVLMGCSDVGEQTLNVKAAGLWLTANPLDAPPGALSKADNVVIRRPNIVEPRRGQKPDTELDAGVSEMTAFEGQVVAHLDDGDLITRDGVNSFITVGTGLTAPTGHPMRFAEAGGGLYLTTNAGPQRLDSLTSSVVPAGTPPGLEGSGTTTGSSGWLATGRVVGYRFVWGSRDGDGALLLGAPSGRVLVTNGTGSSKDVSLTTPIPDGVVAGTHFLQVYRTVIDAASGDDPGEDMAQVLEVFPTAAQISAGTMTVSDIASFANGATAYFSPSVGAGLADSKQQPPLLTDAIAFKGYLFGVVQAYQQQLNVSLLATGGTSGGLLEDEGIQFTDGTSTEIYYANTNAADEGNVFDFGNPKKIYFYLDLTSPTASEQIENTARSLVRAINLRSELAHGYYSSGPSDIPGSMLFTSIAVGGDRIEVKAWRNAAAWVPSLVNDFTGTPVRVGSTVTVTTDVNYHHLVTGQTVTLLTGSVDFPPGAKTITVTGNDTFTYAEAGAAVTGSDFEWTTSTDPVYMDQEAVPGSWAHSAFQQPDAWPPRFQYQVGGPNTRLDRITAQGEALLFWTSDGLYRLTGDTEDNFTLRPVDPTVNLVGTSTPATMGNKAMALTTQGVVSVTDLGVEKVSTAVDQALLPYYAGTDANRALADAYAFGVAYQSENEYMLFLPSLTGSPDASSMAYIFNVQTGAWTINTWEWEGINEDTDDVAAGVVNPVDGFLYLGSSTWLTRERKDRALSDYQDADDVGIPIDVAYVVQTAKNPGALKQWTEVACLMEAPQPSSVELYFTTEIDSSEEGGTIPSQGNSAVRTYIPTNKSRSARLTVGIRHSAAQEKPSILGLSVVYNTSSTRVGR